MFNRIFFLTISLLLSIHIEGLEDPAAYAIKCLEAHLYPEVLLSLNSLPPELQQQNRLIIAHALIGLERFEEARSALAAPPHTKEETLLYIDACKGEDRWDLAIAFLADEPQFQKEKTTLLMEKALADGDFNVLVKLKGSSFPPHIQDAAEEAARAHIIKISTLIMNEETLSAENLLALFPYRELSLQDPLPFQLYEAIFAMKRGELDFAKQKLKTIAESPQYKGEALFWLAETLELQQASPEEILKIRSDLLTLPEGPYTAETAFRLFSWHDYLQGEKKALKHLKKFVKQHEKTPHAIVAYWLLGLDALNEREDPAGKKIHALDNDEALIFFAKAEELFSELSAENRLSLFFTQIAEEASIEKVRLFLLIAKESSSSKRLKPASTLKNTIFCNQSSSTCWAIKKGQSMP
jgi:hypothetical protein